MTGAYIAFPDTADPGGCGGTTARRSARVALSSAPPEQSGLAAGVNDMFRQAGIAVGVAALGALIPAGAAFGDGSPQSFVDGFHDALWVGAVLALAAAAAAAVLIRGAGAAMPREAALEAA
jgi:hypothetical protein